MTTTTTELKVINEEDKPAVADTVVVVVEDITTPKTVEIDTSDIGDLTKFKPLVTDTLPTKNRTARPSLKKTICGSTISLVILGIISIIPRKLCVHSSHDISRKNRFNILIILN